MEDDTHLPLVMFKKLDPVPSNPPDYPKIQAGHRDTRHEDTNASDRLEGIPENSKSWESNTGIGPMMDKYFPYDAAKRSHETAKRSPEGLMAQLQEI
jgi:hypothetical protein